MPLKQSGSRAAFQSNVKAEMDAGKPQKQALAIAYSVQRKNRADGGAVDGYAMGGILPPMGRLPMRPLHPATVVRPSVAPHVGPIRGPTGGRADARPMAVKPGSYVIPADIVSHLGQGNSDAGHRVLNSMFAPAPMGAGKTGPFGSALPSAKRHGLGLPKPPGLSRLADGGLAPLADPQATDAAPPVPIYAADGEHVLAPEQVSMIGDGDLNKGHNRLDEWVKFERQKAIKTLKSLPGPKR